MSAIKVAFDQWPYEARSERNNLRDDIRRGKGIELVEYFESPDVLLFWEKQKSYPANTCRVIDCQGLSNAQVYDEIFEY